MLERVVLLIIVIVNIHSSFILHHSSREIFSPDALTGSGRNPYIVVVRCVSRLLFLSSLQSTLRHCLGLKNRPSTNTGRR